MWRRPGLKILLPGVAVSAMFLGAASARADVTTPPGNCVGTAAFVDGVDGSFTIDSEELDPDDVTTIPLADEVEWQGTLVGLEEGTNRDIAGSVKVDMPWPLPDLTIDSWSGPSSRTTNSGTKDYSLPSFTPRGVVMQVYGEHREDGTLFCSGSAKVKVDGSPFSSPFAPVSLALVGVSLGLSLLASRRASIGLGAAAGLATMLGLGLALLAFGVLPLNSSLLGVLPVGGLVLGGAWGALGLLAKGAGTAAV